MAEAEKNHNEPERYGRYVLLERIGQGGMAEVFRAVARGTQGFARILVVKRILPELSKDPRFVQMFIDEAKICALISHPNVVQVYEFGRLADTHFMTMEYVHGRNLSVVMEKLASAGRLSPPDVICEIIRQACLGLHHAHTMTNAEGNPLQIIHRDVTPANLMLGFNGAVKVLDFGIARAAEELKETKTQAGAVKGKIAYLAPEQIHRHPIDHRIDVYALGVVMHECLTGQRLFKADNPLAAMKSILEMPVPPPSSTNPAISKKVDQIVARALARDPNLRYSSMKTMALDLESALHEMRYFSQRLPTFLKELFKDEVTESKDRILPKELSAVSAVMNQVTSAPVQVPAEDASGTEELLDFGQNPAQKAWKWVTQATNRKIGAGVVFGAVVAVLLFAFSGESKRGAQAKGGVNERRNTTVVPDKSARVHISIDSFPQGAQITSADGAVLGRTPSTIEFPIVSEEVKLTLTLQGFAPATVAVIADIDKPLFAKLEALPATQVEKPPVGKKTSHKHSRREAMPLDPFAE